MIVKILLASADQLFAQAIQKALEQTGAYKVWIATNGWDAVKSVSIRDYAAMVFDPVIERAFPADFLAECRQRRPDVAIIRASDSRAASDVDIQGILPHYYAPRELALLLAQLTDAPVPAHFDSFYDQDADDQTFQDVLAMIEDVFDLPESPRDETFDLLLDLVQKPEPTPPEGTSFEQIMASINQTAGDVRGGLLRRERLAPAAVAIAPDPQPIAIEDGTFDDILLAISSDDAEEAPTPEVQAEHLARVRARPSHMLFAPSPRTDPLPEWPPMPEESAFDSLIYDPQPPDPDDVEWLRDILLATPTSDPEWALDWLRQTLIYEEKARSDFDSLRESLIAQEEAEPPFYDDHDDSGEIPDRSLEEALMDLKTPNEHEPEMSTQELRTLVDQVNQERAEQEAQEQKMLADELSALLAAADEMMPLETRLFNGEDSEPAGFGEDEVLRIINKLKRDEEPDLPQEAGKAVAGAALALTQLSLESAAELCLLTQGDSVVAQGGRLSQEQDIERIARLVTKGAPGPAGAQIRFIRLESTGKDYHLYSTATTSGMVLSMAFPADTPLRVIRRQAQTLIKELLLPKETPTHDPAEAVPPAPEESPPPELAHYVFAWTPAAPLTGTLSLTVQTAIRELAARREWQLDQIEVHRDHVQLVAGLPTSDIARDAVAEMMAAAGDAIRETGEIPEGDPVWSPGHYVASPGRLLNAREIHRFLQYQNRARDIA